MDRGDACDVKNWKMTELSGGAVNSFKEERKGGCNYNLSGKRENFP